MARPVARPLWAVESGQACRSADAGLAEGGEAVSPGKHASAANLVVHESMDVPQQRPLHEAAVHWLRNMPTRLESEFRTAMQAPVQTSRNHSFFHIFQRFCSFSQFFSGFRVFVVFPSFFNVFHSCSAFL